MGISYRKRSPIVPVRFEAQRSAGVVPERLATAATHRPWSSLSVSASSSARNEMESAAHTGGVIRLRAIEHPGPPVSKRLAVAGKHGLDSLEVLATKVPLVVVVQQELVLGLRSPTLHATALPLPHAVHRKLPPVLTSTSWSGTSIVARQLVQL